MKKIVILVAIICFSFTVKAQDDAFTNDTAKLVEVISEESAAAKARLAISEKFTLKIVVIL